LAQDKLTPFLRMTFSKEVRHAGGTHTPKG
jgi:hypothetical protein